MKVFKKFNKYSYNYFVLTVDFFKWQLHKKILIFVQSIYLHCKFLQMILKIKNWKFGKEDNERINFEDRSRKNGSVQKLKKKYSYNNFWLDFLE